MLKAVRSFRLSTYLSSYNDFHYSCDWAAMHDTGAVLAFPKPGQNR
jgi:hypothetical protein